MLTTPERISEQQRQVSAFLDTGSDCTLLPIDWIIPLNPKPDGRAISIFGVGKKGKVLAISF